jgi:hypothetical protein
MSVVGTIRRVGVVPLRRSLVTLFVFVLFISWDIFDIDVTVYVASLLLISSIYRYRCRSREAVTWWEEAFPTAQLKGVGERIKQPLLLVFRGDEVDIDTRLLGTFRIGLGALIAADVISQLRNFGLLYQATGLYPYDMVKFEPAYQWGKLSFQTTFPIWELTSSWLLAGIVFAGMFVSAISLAVGYRTRLSTIGCFLGIVSLQARNPWSLSIADKLLVLTVFWAIFVPLEARYSVDSVLDRGRIRPQTTVRSLGTAAILFQLVVLYFVNGWQKLSVEEGILVEKQFDLLPLVLAADEKAWPHAQAASELVPLDILQALSGVWTLLLIVSPLLLTLRGRRRLLVLLPLAGAHMIMAATFRIGTFPFTTLLLLLLFVDTAVVDRFVSFTPSLDHDRLEMAARDVYGPIEARVRKVDAAASALLSSVGNAAYRLLDRRPTRGAYRRACDLIRQLLSSQESVSNSQSRWKQVSILLLIVSGLVVTGAAGFQERDRQLETGEYWQVESDSVRETPAALFGLRQGNYRFFAVRNDNTEWYEVRVQLRNQDRVYDVRNDRYVAPLSSSNVSRPYELGSLHEQFDTYRGRFFRDEHNYLSNVARGRYYCQLINDDGTERYADMEATTISYVRVEEHYNMSTRTTLEGRSYETETLMDSYTCGKPTGGLEPRYPDDLIPNTALN